MVFVETRAFTTRVQTLLSDDEYRALQLLLSVRPAAGELISGTGGLRKIRWGREGRGKRGGLRAIYYWHGATDRVLMLFIFAKNERSDLSPAQRKALRKVVEREYR